MVPSISLFRVTAIAPCVTVPPLLITDYSAEDNNNSNNMEGSDAIVVTDG